MSIQRKIVKNDIAMSIQLRSGNKLVIWNNTSCVQVLMKNDSQLGWQARCEYSISENGMTINAVFRGSRESYVGVHRVFISFIDGNGLKVSLDSPVFVMVKSSSELEHEVIEYALGSEDGATITSEEGLIIKVSADTYRLTNNK